MERKRYSVMKKFEDFGDFTKPEIWSDIPPLFIEIYKWVQNDYAPKVAVRIFHTRKFIYVYYHVPEKRVTIRHTTFGSDVFKDSCVEFFINPFPEASAEYVNLELNALGVMLIGIGKDGDDSKRHYFKKADVEGFETVSSIKKPVVGDHGAAFWTLHVKIPKQFFEKRYGKEFTDKETIANFNKCGDETEYEHYGSWNEILNPVPNFHLPKYFGSLVFV
ncbi:MAG: carbohydrate-binding family 9-like protein [Bacteroidota bacterium]